MEPLLIFEPDGVGGNQQVRPIAPAFQEPPKVLSAQLVTLVIIQLGPLAVFMAHQRQARVGYYLKAFVLELEAIVDVQVTIETEALPH